VCEVGGVGEEHHSPPWTPPFEHPQKPSSPAGGAGRAHPAPPASGCFSCLLSKAVRQHRSAGVLTALCPSTGREESADRRLPCLRVGRKAMLERAGGWLKVPCLLPQEGCSALPGREAPKK
jgi:hypothetical protein